MYEIKINKKSVLTQENIRPALFTNVKVYVGDPWHKPVNGKIRNLSVETEDNRKVTKGNFYIHIISLLFIFI